MEMKRARFVCFVSFCLCLCSGFTDADIGLPCGQNMPVGCRVYTTNDCDRRYTELNRMTSVGALWSGHVDKLYVQPFAYVSQSSPLTRQAGLHISWTLTRDRSQALQGLKLTVTALDDASQSTLCHLLDLSAVTAVNKQTQSVMSYNMTLPRLPGVYNWHVQLESVPNRVNENWSLGVPSAFITTDHLFEVSGGAGSPSCSIIVIVGSRESLLNVTVSHVITVPNAPATSYDVILYECEADDCCVYCLSQAEINTVTSPNEMTSFRGIAPGLYQVWVQPASQPEHVCGRSPDLALKGEASAPPSTIATTTPSAQAIAANVTRSQQPVLPPANSSSLETSTKEYNATETSAVEDDDRHPHRGMSPRPLLVGDGINNDDANGDDVDDRALTYGVIGGMFFFTVLALLSGKGYACWSRRRKAAPEDVKNVPCRETATNSETSQSTYSSSLIPHSCCHGDVILHVTSPPHITPTTTTVPVLLLSYSDHARHASATDSLALYLQAFCACDVTYIRWQLDDIRRQGPGLWTTRQMDKAVCVVFVRGGEDDDRRYEAWKAGKVRDDEATAGLLTAAAALGHVPAVGRVSEDRGQRWFNVKLRSSSDGSPSVGDDLATQSPRPGYKNPDISKFTAACSETSARNEKSPSRVVFENESSPILTRLQSSKSQEGNVQYSLGTGACAGGKASTNIEVKNDKTCSARESQEVHSVGSRDVPKPRNTPPKTLAETRVSCYHLMTDFNHLLADLHKIPNNPTEFRARDLPVSNDLPDTLEGRELLKSVTPVASPCHFEPTVRGDDYSVTGVVFGGSYRCEARSDRATRKEMGTHTFSRERWSCSPVQTGATVFSGTKADLHAQTGTRPGRVEDCHQPRQKERVPGEGSDGDGSGGNLGRKTKDGDGVDRLESDYGEELGWCFVGPDDLSAVNTEVSSLGSRFRSINARYEQYVQLEDSVSRADCYTLGEWSV